MAPPSPGSRALTPAINAWSGDYLEAQYKAFKADPGSIPADLRSFFEGFDLALARGASATPAGATPPGARGDIADVLRFQSGVATLIEAYRALGHIAAKTDPFGRDLVRPDALNLAHHRLSEADLGRVINTDITAIPHTATLRELIAFLEETYCSSIGVQTAHISNSEERHWLIGAMERSRGRIPLTRGQKAHILERIIRAESFERFLQNRYPGEKRFSLEGGEAVIALLDHAIETGADNGVEEMVLGMAHRGRLNVLHNVLGKTLEQIFTEFEDSWAALVDGGGDVKYHRGYSGERTLGNGRKIHLAMASNPSHLESVNGVVLGRTRAKQRVRNDTQKRLRVMPLLIHGDAAIIGQGTVQEALNLSQLDGYKVGGCLHVVVNNLIGFTTGPEDARASRYCTDIALMLESPIFHVNGEDPEAVVTCAQLAVEYRQKFRKDVFIDFVCYRKYGHNEQDEASFTQPRLTQLIRQRQNQSVLKTYAARLLAEGVINEDDIKAIADRLDQALEAAQRSAREKPYDPTIDPGSWRWKGFNRRYTFEPPRTAVSKEMIHEVCAALGRVPETFNLNPKLQRLLADRAALPQTGLLSYADAESIAFGTLLLEGHGVRISGQDARRGTFSHRHAVLRDMQTEERYLPLNNMRFITEDPDQAGKPGPDGKPTQARLCVYDSPLSEAAVMAFDYGYSLSDPTMLVCWEAQFGDFVNGAQVIIDQYIASAELKWERWSGLTLLLPHGYEGAGPEHSSARIERFLQLCGDDNMQVVYPSTAAQCFHMFRRQIKAPYRKPLIVFTPKSLLRVTTSHIDELTTGHFQNIIDDVLVTQKKLDPSKVKTVLWTSGKVYHELHDRREKTGTNDKAIVRVEQYYPFDAALAKRIASQYKNAQHVWVQEEPRNMGAYIFLADIFRNHPELKIELGYIGRPQSATPAVGSKKEDRKQQEKIISTAVAPAPAQSPPGPDAAKMPNENGAHAPGGTNGVEKQTGRKVTA